MYGGRMRGKRPSQPPAAIHLLVAEIDLSTLEVIELDPDEAPRRPGLELLAGLPSPRETAYARPGTEPGSLRGLWEAFSRLDP
jgi:hypothetical protein